MLTFGTKLLKLRREHKLSQTEIADIIGVKQATYSSWESDEHDPHIENLLKLSQYYNVSLEELVDENKKMSLSINDINGNNNVFANEKPTINFSTTPEIIELLQKQGENILKFMSSQQEQNLKILESQQEQQATTAKLLEYHFKIIDLLNNKK